MSEDNIYSAPESVVSDTSEVGQGITAGTFEALRRTRPWTMFIAVVMFVSVFFVLLGLVTLLSASVQGLPIAFGYLLVAAVYLMIGIFLVQYSNASARAVRTRSARWLETAMVAQLRFWRAAGIITLLGIIAMVAAILVPVYMQVAR